MPQPIMTKYKQGDLGKPYPKKGDKMKNMNLSAHGGEADVDIATKDYPKIGRKLMRRSIRYGRAKDKKKIN